MGVSSLRPKKTYLIIELNRGALAGFYSERGTASEVRAYLAEELPGQWMLVEVLEGPESYRLPDERFWTEMFPLVPLPQC